MENKQEDKEESKSLLVHVCEEDQAKQTLQAPEPKWMIVLRKLLQDNAQLNRIGVNTSK